MSDKRGLRATVFGIFKYSLKLTLAEIKYSDGIRLIDAVIQDAKARQRGLDNQIEDAVNSLIKSAQIIDDLNKSLNTKKEQLKSVQSEYHETLRLISITDEQKGAIAGALEKAVNKDRNKERIIAAIISFGVGLVFYVAGVVTSDPVRDILKPEATTITDRNQTLKTNESR
ncbi:hypothetical protein [Mesorhizobium sp. SP-1A]|uniref:hypothetical protein n=1 Tax=Mesorhizobium sp. SP-1A TaxID=3077840 RepID=UPI0028F71E8A|nr:hypothetical protein [Mesorhizobium sp. SP-1A]